MKIGKYEFGLVRPFGWYGFKKDTKCLAGCTIYMFGPFFFTILAGDCISYVDGETDDCIVSIEPVKDSLLKTETEQLEEHYVNKASARERKRQRKQINNGKGLPKRKKRKLNRKRRV
jgi:hypothetical protein